MFLLSLLSRKVIRDRTVCFLNNAKIHLFTQRFTPSESVYAIYNRRALSTITSKKRDHHREYLCSCVPSQGIYYLALSYLTFGCLVARWQEKSLHSLSYEFFSGYSSKGRFCNNNKIDTWDSKRLSVENKAKLSQLTRADFVTIAKLTH